MYKVCFIAPVHVYDDIRIFHKEAKTLSDNGYEVTIIARAQEDFIQENIKIRGIKYKNRKERFLLSYKILKMALENKYNVYHIHNPETIPIGVVLKIINKKVVYDCHENFVEKIDSRQWIPGILKGISKFGVIVMEKLAGIMFNKIIVTQAEVGERIGKGCILIENPPILDMRDKITVKYNAFFDDVIKLCYIGSITEDRGIFNIIDVIEEVNKSHECILNLAGPCDEIILNQLKSKKGYKYVKYHGRLEQLEAFKLLNESDIGMITILDRGGYRNTNPNKLFEYMMFGKPFIASNFEKWKESIHGCDCGIFVNPDDKKQIAYYIEQLYSNNDMYHKMSFNGEEFIRYNYNWGKEGKKLLDMYLKILKDGEV